MTRTPFEAIGNFREVTGISTPTGPLRRGVLYRSGWLMPASQKDLDVLGQQLGLARVYDLRRAREVEPDLVTRLSAAGVRHESFPLRRSDGPPEPGTDESALLTGAFAAARPDLAALVCALARDDVVPVVVSCVLGRDRTGLAVAVLLGLLGAPDQEIAQEYALTSEAAAPAQWSRRLRWERGIDAVAELGRTRPEAVHRLFASVRSRYGDLEHALAPFGVTRQVREALRARLLEK
ncbi:tyrosine-protein phosphatase [Streptomyces sp. NPDC051913]|uniref:tyrosine-protein phosphatase n=1 Tax=Streptomyces sp. NPDC051913 TaxID=3365676 RepID=UPI0037CCF19C